jgi:hypothetical protein
MVQRILATRGDLRVVARTIGAISVVFYKTFPQTDPRLAKPSGCAIIGVVPDSQKVDYGTAREAILSHHLVQKSPVRSTMT